jgi:hypothetical protein
MSSAVRRGLLVALLHVLLVAGLGAKLLIDRATRPRVWARVLPVDPDLPIRGRYVQLQVEGAAEGIEPSQWTPVAATVRDRQLVFVPATGSNVLWATVTQVDGRPVAMLHQPLAYFIPEHVPDPSRRQPGEELWVEVTIPRRGPPRPIRLGVRKDGELRVLE